MPGLSLRRKPWISHYEITRYGTLRRWTTELGMKTAAVLLDNTLQEETRTDEYLTEIARRQQTGELFHRMELERYPRRDSVLRGIATPAKEISARRIIIARR